MVRTWDFLSPLPDDVFGDYLAAVLDALEAQAYCDELAALPLSEQPKRCDLRAERRRLRDITETAQLLEQEVLVRVRSVAQKVHAGVRACDLGFVLVALPASSVTLVQLCARGYLSNSLKLLRDTQDLHRNWQLCGGLALSAAHPHKEPVPQKRRDCALEVIRELGHASGLGSTRPVHFTTLIPILDAVHHAMADLRAHLHRAKRDAEHSSEDRRSAAQHALRGSMNRQRGLLLRKKSLHCPAGFDAATDCAPGPVHLEKRLDLNDYRTAERLSGFYTRENARRNRRASEALLSSPPLDEQSGGAGSGGLLGAPLDQQTGGGLSAPIMIPLPGQAPGTGAAAFWAGTYPAPPAPAPPRPLVPPLAPLPPPAPVGFAASFAAPLPPAPAAFASPLPPAAPHALPPAPLAPAAAPWLPAAPFPAAGSPYPAAPALPARPPLAPLAPSPGHGGYGFR